MHVTVPPVPDEADRGWRKWLTGVDDRTSRRGAPTAKGGEAALGPFLAPGDVVDVPIGALMVVVDKRLLRFDWGYYGGWVPVHDATVTLYLVEEERGLRALWSRHYKRAASAFGTSTRNKVIALLAQYPPPEGQATVVEEAQRPNRTSASCRWCGASVPTGQGHLIGRDQDIQVEHWRQCPTRPVTPGTACVECGVSTHSGNAAQSLVRDGAGRWETRHDPRLRCTETSVQSYEERQAERAAAQQAQVERHRQQRKRAEAAQRRREQARQRRAATKATALAAERARIAELREVGRETTTVREKNAGDNRRAHLLQHTIHLEDGTTTTRWSVEVAGGSLGWSGDDYDPDPGEISAETDVWDTAVEAYRAHSPRRSRTRTRSGSRARTPIGATSCPPDGADHCEHCATTDSAGGWMLANGGLACGPDCYAAMAERRGSHARMYHY